MPQRYVPDAGDVVWLNLTPQAGREQARAKTIALIGREKPPKPDEAGHPLNDSFSPRRGASG
jgi:hypothetical protein